MACQSCSGYLRMGKRVFIGMPVGEVFRDRACAFRVLHDNLPVRWISPENQHVTLVPPWYCDDVERFARNCTTFLIMKGLLRFVLTKHLPDRRREGHVLSGLQEEGMMVWENFRKNSHALPNPKMIVLRGGFCSMSRLRG